MTPELIGNLTKGVLVVRSEVNKNADGKCASRNDKIIDEKREPVSHAHSVVQMKVFSSNTFRRTKKKKHFE